MTMLARVSILFVFFAVAHAARNLDALEGTHYQALLKEFSDLEFYADVGNDAEAVMTRDGSRIALAILYGYVILGKKGDGNWEHITTVRLENSPDVYGLRWEDTPEQDRLIFVTDDDKREHPNHVHTASAKSNYKVDTSMAIEIGSNSINLAGWRPFYIIDAMTVLFRSEVETSEAGYQSEYSLTFTRASLDIFRNNGGVFVKDGSIVAEPDETKETQVGYAFDVSPGGSTWATCDPVSKKLVFGVKRPKNDDPDRYTWDEQYTVSMRDVRSREKPTCALAYVAQDTIATWPGRDGGIDIYTLVEDSSTNRKTIQIKMVAGMFSEHIYERPFGVRLAGSTNKRLGVIPEVQHDQFGDLDEITLIEFDEETDSWIQRQRDTKYSILDGANMLHSFMLAEDWTVAVFRGTGDLWVDVFKPQGLGTVVGTSPTEKPTPAPTEFPTFAVTKRPTARPTEAAGTPRPTTRPTKRPTPKPSALPPPAPTPYPTSDGTNDGDDGGDNVGGGSGDDGDGANDGDDGDDGGDGGDNTGGDSGDGGVSSIMRILGPALAGVVVLFVVVLVMLRSSKTIRHHRIPHHHRHIEF